MAVAGGPVTRDAPGPGATTPLVGVDLLEHGRLVEQCQVALKVEVRVGQLLNIVPKTLIVLGLPLPVLQPSLLGCRLVWVPATGRPCRGQAGLRDCSAGAGHKSHTSYPGPGKVTPEGGDEAARWETSKPEGKTQVARATHTGAAPAGDTAWTEPKGTITSAQPYRPVRYQGSCFRQLV